MLKKVLYSALVLIVLAGLALSWLFYDIQQFMSERMNVSDEGLVVKVNQGSNLTRIAYQLHRQGVLTQPRYLIWYAQWTSQAKKIHIGEYRLEKNSTPLSFLQSIAEGEVIQYSITIVEGWTFKQMLTAIKSNQYIEHTVDELTSEQIMTKLGHTGEHPEGRFMPDTYHFPRGITDLVVLDRAYLAMQAYLEKEWEKRDVGIPVKTPYEALILASIVEKETGLASERSAIAGVFARRLIKGMRLQSDPTVIYGMGDRYDGNIKRRDLLRDNPYNTYRNFGLPPTPIALPGRDAIHAVFHPQEADALYFVSKGDGSHYFSATLKEHNEAVIKYQLKGRKRPFSSYKTENNK
jgi:UPF0755 protein